MKSSRPSAWLGVLVVATVGCGTSAPPPAEGAAATTAMESGRPPAADGGDVATCFVRPDPEGDALAQAKRECDASIEVINRGVEAFGTVADLVVMADQMDRVATDACALRIRDEGLLDLMQGYRGMAIKVSTTLRRIDAAIRVRDVETLQAMDGVMARATSVEAPIVEAINRHCSALTE